MAKGKAEKPKGRKPAPDAQAVAPLLESMELTDLRLLQCLAHQGEKKQQPTELTQTTEVRVARHPTESIAVFVLTFKISGGHFAIEGHYGLHYRLTPIEACSDEDLQILGQTAAIHVAWPYWREFVHTTTANMGFQPLRLPLFQIGRHEFTAMDDPLMARPQLK